MIVHWMPYVVRQALIADDRNQLNLAVCERDCLAQPPLNWQIIFQRPRPTLLLPEPNF